MFSLIIAIVAIALVIAVTLIGTYYGGATISEAEAQTQAARLKNEEQQILAALEMFNAELGRYPLSMQELIDNRFLNTVPQGVVMSGESGVELVSRARAQAAAPGWVIPVAGQPIFTTSGPVPVEVCKKYNLVSRGDDGILRLPFEGLPSQCYGAEDVFQVVVLKPGAAASLRAALAPVQVVGGNIPPVQGGETWWEVAPTGPLRSPVDDTKTAVADLQLQQSGAESFGLVQVGDVRSASARSILNAGTADAEGVTIHPPVGFRVASNTCGLRLTAGATCSFTLEFSPTLAQPYSGTVSVGSANAGVRSFEVTGDARAASATLSNVSFGSVAAGSVTTLSSTLSNTGVGPLQLGALRVAGAGFAVGNTTCGQVLVAGASCTIEVAYSPSGVAAAAGSLYVHTEQTGDVAASITGQSKQAVLGVFDAVRAFGSVQVGQVSAGGVHRIENSGNSPAVALNISPPAGFRLASNACPSTLAAGAQCTFTLAFAPIEARPYSAGVVISSSANALSVEVSGTGVAQAASLSAIDYGGVGAFDMPRRTSTLRNEGVGPLEVNGSELTIEGSFSVPSHNCNGVLAAGASCTVDVTYNPGWEPEDRKGALLVPTSAGVLRAVLQGRTLVPVLAINRTEHNFGDVPRGVPLTTTAFSLTNQGNGPITGLALPASANGNCTSTLNAGATCSFTITTTYNSYGQRNDPYNVSAANTSGVGFRIRANVLEPQLSMTSAVAFGTHWVGGPAVERTVTLENTGGVPVSVNVWSPGTQVDALGLYIGSTDCSASLAAGASCMVVFRLDPEQAGQLNTYVSFDTSAGSRVVSLSGTINR